mgnify:CR=1 FL=1
MYLHIKSFDSKPRIPYTSFLQLWSETDHGQSLQDLVHLLSGRRPRDYSPLLSARHAQTFGRIGFFLGRIYFVIHTGRLLD